MEKSSWAKSPLCEGVMKANNLKNVEELQSYFVKEWRNSSIPKAKS
nr:family 20 glycosylhydrolase [Chitinophaga pinensis]